MRDYFTNATKNTQQGDAVTLPLGTTAPVIGNGNALGLTNSTPGVLCGTGNNVGNENDSGAFALGVTMDTVQNATVGQNISGNIRRPTSTLAYGVSTDATKSGLIADLTEALGATVTSFRQMIMTQVLLENDNRGGVRYTELMQKRYGAINPDLRLHRPQYLGGTASPLFTTPVIQTSGTGTSGQNTPQGNIAGYGTNGDSGNVIKASFGEFGYIIGFACCQATPQYQQGLDRKWTRFERFDYYYPEFNGLSDQAILNKEIYAQGDNITDPSTGEIIDNQVWGYIGRYDELRYFKNEICGELRSNYEQTLDSWHYAEKFENLPVYSSEFIEDKTDQIVARTLAYEYEDIENKILAPQLITDFQFSGQVYRVLPSKALPMFARSM